jgi:NhaA family Na+:H+ antiporter
MKSQTLTAPLVAAPSGARRLARLSRFVVDRFLLLPVGATIALVWANLAPESYFPFAHAVAFPVNEIGMALFLALIGQDVVEAMMAGGALHTWRRWGLTMIAAAGGLAGGALTYVVYVSRAHEAVLLPAWPVAAAVDIAAGYYLLKLLWPRTPAVPFFVVMAVMIDGALMLLASRPVFAEVRGGGILVLMVALTMAFVLRVQQFAPIWIFVIAGPVAWLAMWLEGVHPAFALLPLVPFLPRTPRQTQLFADVADDGPVHHFEHRWNEAAQVVLFFFGLVNAGVLLRGYDTGSLAVVTAAVVGRPLGVLAALALGVAIGLRLPRGMDWRQALVVALATSSGFTFALFFASSLLPAGAVLAQIKVGALATVAGALVVAAASWLLRRR